MSTDTTALQERIAEALAEHWRRKHSTLLTSGPCSGCPRAAADAVAAEVRKAKAEAWEEGTEAVEYSAETRGFLRIPDVNPYRETGGQR